MLIKLSVENYKSFDSIEELNMLASGKIRLHPTHKADVSGTSVLKSTVVYGANASGKSNLVDIFRFIKRAVIEGLPVNSSRDFCRTKEENEDRVSSFELQFSYKGHVYAYGFSTILNDHQLFEEWLYELSGKSDAKLLFEVPVDRHPIIGGKLKLNRNESNRLQVYADDYAGNATTLFLTEMNRGKKYDEDSGMRFFRDVYEYIQSHIVILDPNTGISDVDLFTNDASLETIVELIRSFDTGIEDVQIRDVTMDELSRMIPQDVLQNMVRFFRLQMEQTGLPSIQVLWRTSDYFVIVKITDEGEPKVSTIQTRHESSFFDFEYKEESDGTKRLFDLISIILSNKEDMLYVVDELERSLHPKLTEHFLELFMEAHAKDHVQLLFTSHEDTIMTQELFRRDEIWFVERNASGASTIYSLDKFKERYDKVLNKAYLAGRYGAIPVFKTFSFSEEG